MPRQSREPAVRARHSSLHGRSRQVLHQAFVLGCAERVEVIRHSPVDSLTATETGPQQDFDNTENVVETPPWPIDTLRALARRSKDANQSRRLLSLAAVRDGMDRGSGAKIGGEDRGHGPPDAA